MGPPTEPCRTPLPCTNSGDSLPLLSISWDVAPCPPIPESKFTSSCVMSCGMPRACQLIACDQYSIVSKALDRSATNTCSSCSVTLASSIISARMRSGAAVPAFGIAPYWLRSRILCLSIAVTIRPITMCSNVLTRHSISVIGLVLFISASPLSVLGSSRIMAVLMELGTPPLFDASCEERGQYL